jgi:precorrin-3B methylase
MTDMTALTLKANEIVISNNEQFIFYAEYLKTVTRAISDAEKLKDTLKQKIKAYRDAQNEETERQTRAVLRIARMRVQANPNAMLEPAVATNMVPEVAGLHYRTKLKWRVRNFIEGPYMKSLLQSLSQHRIREA